MTNLRTTTLTQDEINETALENVAGGKVIMEAASLEASGTFNASLQLDTLAARPKLVMPSFPAASSLPVPPIR